MGLLVGLMDIATANNTVAIVMANPIAKEMSGNYGISNKKAASILDTFSCVFQGILPYGAQMLVAISAATGLGETINAFDILPLLFYPYMLLLSSLVFISFEKRMITDFDEKEWMNMEQNSQTPHKRRVRYKGNTRRNLKKNIRSCSLKNIRIRSSM